MKNIFKTVGISLTLLIVFLGFSTTSSAIEYFSIGGKPAYPDPNIPNSISWFIYNLDLGQQKEDALYVINTFNEPLELLVYAADGVKSSSGGFAVKQFVEPKEDVGAWVKFYPDPVPNIFTNLFQQNNESIVQFCNLQLGQQYTTEEKESFVNWCKGEESVQMTLPSNEKSLLKFVFSVPEITSVGEHTGGILIQKVEPEINGTKEGISLTTRVGIRIYQTVPGDILKDLSIRSFTLEKLYKELDFKRFFKRDLPPEETLITTEIENSGNVSVDFTEKISIKQVFPKKKDIEVDDRQFQVLRDDMFISNFSWENPRIGKFNIQNSVLFENIEGNEEEIKSKIITIWIIPWREIIVGFGVLALILIIFLLKKAINKKRYSGKGWITYTIQKGETLEDISNKFNVKWKRLAKTNKLKPPYALVAGKRILVPKKK